MTWNDKLTNFGIQGEVLFKSKYKEESPKHGFQSLLTDPYSLQYAMGFKERQYSLSYNVLKRIPVQLGVIAAIIQTRCNQVASFSSPYRLTKSLGYEIKHKNPARLTTKGEREMILSMEQFIYNCGFPNPNPQDPENYKRDDFDTYLRKIVRDSLTYDQCCLLPGATVELENGNAVFIENLIPGDKVLAGNGQYKEVLKITSRKFVGDVIHIGFSVGTESISATDTHPVFAAKKTSLAGNTVELSKPEWIPAKDITKNHYLAYPKLKPRNEQYSFPIFARAPRKYFNEALKALVKHTGLHKQTIVAILSNRYKRNSPELVSRIKNLAADFGVTHTSNRIQEELTLIDSDFAKFLGLYVAEGNSQNNAVKLTFHKNEQYLVDFVVKFGQKYGINNTIVNYKDRQGITVILNSKALMDFVEEYCGVGCDNKKVPCFIFNSTQKIRDSFLYGYLVGDGHQSANATTLTTVSKTLFYGLRQLLSADNMRLTLSYWDPKTAREGSRRVYRGQISGQEYAKFAERVGFPYKSTNLLKYKYDDDFIYIKARDIKKTPTSGITVYNCEVEDEHSYVAGGFLNHNCTELVPTVSGTPYEFLAVDASTIRIAAESVGLVPDATWEDREPRVDNPALLGLPFNPYSALKYKKKDKKPAYVQVVNGQIVQAYTTDELAFGIRNPRTDVLVQGYGFSEIEMIISLLVSFINAETYNKNFFISGSSPKGIINFKGDSMSPEMLENFQRQWKANISGVNNSWNTPILQSEQGVEFIDLHRSNMDMEYSKWLEYLLKLCTAVYNIDPAEINFDLSGGVSQTPLFESSSEWKLKASRDKGLKPLLKFIAKHINDNVVSKIDDAFYFDFVGLDELTDQEKHELRQEQLSSYMTLNETRRALDLPDIEGGDWVLNPVFLQSKTTQMQMDAQKSQQQQQQPGQQPGGQPGQGEGPTPNDEDDTGSNDVEAPSYSARFTKSVNNTKILEISLDDETWYDLAGQ